MSKIKILPPEVVNKIAAGEVVERPASIVKELIENSIDAQATKIKIEIVKAGKKNIQVTDNGEGMDEEDVRKCYIRHGTSKLSNLEDLQRIKTLGFRGEALASIAAIAKVVIISKRRGQTAGTKAEIKAGKLKNLTSIGTASGTKVSVKDIFFNVPARKKFIKTDHTEFHHILEIFNSYALAFPEIGFSLYHNNREIYSLPRNQNLPTRISYLLGKDISSALINVFFDHPHLKIEGYITKPQVARKSRFAQYIFINKRPIKNRLVASAVNQAYQTMLPKGTYPPFVLFLQLPPYLIDVNVHPRKEEIKFVNEGFIYQKIKLAVSQSLAKDDLTFKANYNGQPPQLLREIKEKPKEFRLKEPIQFAKAQSFPKVSTLADRESFPQTLPWEKDLSESSALPVIQLHNLYIVTQTNSGILIIDQHAAHERILYEKYLNEFKQKRKISKQPLLIPEPLWLSTLDVQYVKNNRKLLSKLGFEFLDLGKNNFKITSIPGILQGKKIALLIKEIIDDLRSNITVKDIDDQSQLAISYLACRSAVKAGDVLSSNQCRQIIEDLNKSKIEYTCPHGRPTKIEITLDELAKMFKRK